MPAPAGMAGASPHTRTTAGYPAAAHSQLRLRSRVGSQRPVPRRWRRCISTIEAPAPISSSPSAIVQRRSSPVNGRVLAFAVDGLVPLAGLLLVDGDVSLVGDVD